MAAAKTTALCPAPSSISGPTNDDSPADSPSPANGDGTSVPTGDNSKQQLQRLEERKRKLRREKLLRRAIPVLLVAPWFLGLIWTALHPLASVITGELKCRGKYIDENGLDVHRHRVEGYPLERVVRSSSGRRRTRNAVAVAESSASGGMCDAVRSRPHADDVSPSVECLVHEATDAIAFDVARILPPMGPVIEATEAMVLVVGDKGHGNNDNGDWYERSDLNASIMHLIKKLGSKEDCPWLTKAVYVVAPAASMTDRAMDDVVEGSSIPPLESIVDAFIASYSGESPNSRPVRPLPPDFAHPILRSVLVVNDVESKTSRIDGGRTEVRILPQGVGGALPNLDLVFAAFLSLQSHPAGERYTPSHSIYHGDSEFSAHPFDNGGEMEERFGRLLERVGNIFGLKSSAMAQYAKDLAGLFGFAAGLVVGPRQPHASALDRGIDSLTIEVRIPGDGSAPSPSIHPHYADLARCVEHLLRSISNLHERLHHSIAQYTMPSPSKFVSHGEYVYPAILVSLPMVVRAATLALRDLRRFHFLHAGAVLLSACTATVVFGAWAIYGTGRRRGAENDATTSEWISRMVFFISSLLVVSVARLDKSNVHKWADDANIELTKKNGPI